MILQNLKLTRFRNHKAFELDFSDGVNLIVGQNGAGKTNILEAVYLLSTGKSFRARYDHEMIYNPKIFGQEKPLLDIFDGGLTTKDFAKVTAVVKSDAEVETVEDDIGEDRKSDQPGPDEDDVRHQAAPFGLASRATSRRVALWLGATVCACAGWSAGGRVLGGFAIIASA